MSIVSVLLLNFNTFEETSLLSDFQFSLLQEFWYEVSLHVLLQNRSFFSLGYTLELMILAFLQGYSYLAYQLLPHRLGNLWLTSFSKFFFMTTDSKLFWFLQRDYSWTFWKNLGQVGWGWACIPFVTTWPKLRLYFSTYRDAVVIFKGSFQKRALFLAANNICQIEKVNFHIQNHIGNISNWGGLLPEIPISAVLFQIT